MASLNEEEHELPRADDPGIFLVVEGYFLSVPFRRFGGRGALSL
ncbi:MAG: hypothetical protein ACKO23_10920 [Gemmataceae bacterium]